MSAAQKVDVLAVLERTSAGLHSVASACKTDLSTPMRARAEELDEARAAVAELIERADNAEKIIRNCVNAGQLGAGYTQHADDLRDLLARIGGDV